MKQLCFLTLLCVLALAACNNNSNTTAAPTNAQASQAPAKQATPKLEALLQTIFESKFPNYTGNDLVRQKAVQDLGKAVDTIAELKYLEDRPMKVLRIVPSGKKRAIVHFYVDKPAVAKNLSDKVQFDVLGFMSEEQATAIDDKKVYYLRGHNYKPLKESAVFALVQQVYYSPGVAIEKEPVLDYYNFNLGDFKCDIDSVIEVY